MSYYTLNPTDKDKSFHYEDELSLKDIEKSLTSYSIDNKEELNRLLHLQILDIKAENGSLRRALEETEKKLQDESKNRVEEETFIRSDTKHVEQIKILQDKLTQANARLYESKNTCLSLRQELNKAQKLLQSEVGDNISIASLSNYPGGWKGRSQQIQQLQQKIIELQSKNESERASRLSLVSCDKRNTLRTKSIDQERRHQIENLEKELRQAEVTLEDRKKKLEASKARIKVLENDLNTLKSNLIISNEKNNRNDQLIEALNGQLQAIEGRYHEREIDLRSQNDKLARDYDNLKKELGCSRLQVEQLRKKLHEREIEIDTLKSSIPANKSEQLYRPASNKNLQDSLINKSGINSKDPNEYVILSLTAEAESTRLLELVALLNQRLDKERINADNISEILRNERYKNVKLEKKMEKLEIERTTTSRSNSSYRVKSSRSSVSFLQSNDGQFEQTNYKLELLQEECLALKARLATVHQEKATDLATFKQMLEQTKKIIQEHLRGKATTLGVHSAISF